MLTIATWNIHKGFSQFNRRMVVHELRERLRALDADIVFLQEVVGHHEGHAERFEAWPEEPQHEFLAAEVWENRVYGRNVVYDHGHHGNAILTRFPILASHNQDVTRLRFEKRGLLYCVVAVPDLPVPLHCVCAHLSLFGRSRRHQYAALAAFIEANVPPDAPLIIAGDFNDWRGRACEILAPRLNLAEVFAAADPATRRPTRSFPAALPILRLDRIYVRGLAVEDCAVHHGPPWSMLSDHAALTARLSFQATAGTP
ncbi:endonuclease/exonuclease/phosphatase family protein [Sulfuricystis multivorans]|uniref:endonuclease/exonuclease/phosphatase family protein n=1 Tax=Sulfuricystis multivorans TaxID=2211108 RepID=UPI0024DFD1C4|nr:endonuclease/exonuclease/phosphatase family protein [Sulfuricystis multivorans]